MNGKELRIGNWVTINPPIKELYPQAKVYRQIQQIYFEDESDFNPIPLTHEILEKCGFMPYENGYSISLASGYFIDWEEEKGLSIAYEANTDIKSMDNHYTEGKYLHQLQNLYFALTGEELPVQNLMPENKNPININA